MKNEIKKLLDICIVGGVYSWKKLPSLKRKKEKRCTCVKMKLRTASQAHHTTADMRFRSPRSLHPNCSPLRYEQLLISANVKSNNFEMLARGQFFRNIYNNMYTNIKYIWNNKNLY